MSYCENIFKILPDNIQKIIELNSKTLVFAALPVINKKIKQRLRKLIYRVFRI